LKAKFDVIRKDRDYYTEGTVQQVDVESKLVYFKFRGMQDKWNEWVEAESTRIAPHQAYTRAPRGKGTKKADKKVDKKDGERKRSDTPSSVASSTDGDADMTSAPPRPANADARAIQTNVNMSQFGAPQGDLSQGSLLQQSQLAQRSQDDHSLILLIQERQAQAAAQAQYAQWIQQRRRQQQEQQQQQQQYQQQHQYQQHLAAGAQHSYHFGQHEHASLQHQQLPGLGTDLQVLALQEEQRRRTAAAAAAAHAMIHGGVPAAAAYSNAASARVQQVSVSARPNPQSSTGGGPSSSEDTRPNPHIK
jgi:hypothetical protein